MYRTFKLAGLALAFLSAFGFVLIPATPSYAAAGLPSQFVDILRDPAMLARVKKADPRLHAKIVRQSGDARVRISAAEFRKLKRYGATEYGSQQRLKHAATEFSSQSRKAKATELSSQVREARAQAQVTVTPHPLDAWITALKKWSDALKAIGATAPGAAFFPVVGVIAAAALVIKLFVDAAISILEAIKATSLAAKPK